MQKSLRFNPQNVRIWLQVCLSDRILHDGIVRSRSQDAIGLATGCSPQKNGGRKNPLSQATTRPEQPTQMVQQRHRLWDTEPFACT